MGALLVAPGFVLQQESDPFQVVSDFLNSPFLALAFRLFVLFFVVLWLALVYWTFTDAGRRGALRTLWGLVALVFPFIGPLVYLIVRPPEYVLDSRERDLELAVLERELRNRVNLCPNCRALVERDYLLCPECGWELKQPCGKCERPLNLNWSTCPYCGANQPVGRSKSR